MQQNWKLRNTIDQSTKSSCSPASSRQIHTNSACEVTNVRTLHSMPAAFPPIFTLSRSHSSPKHTLTQPQPIYPCIDPPHRLRVFPQHPTHTHTHTQKHRSCAVFGSPASSSCQSREFVRPEQTCLLRAGRWKRVCCVASLAGHSQPRLFPTATTRGGSSAVNYRIIKKSEYFVVVFFGLGRGKRRAKE